MVLGRWEWGQMVRVGSALIGVWDCGLAMWDYGQGACSYVKGGWYDEGYMRMSVLVMGARGLSDEMIDTACTSPLKWLIQQGVGTKSAGKSAVYLYIHIYIHSKIYNTAGVHYV